MAGVHTRSFRKSLRFRKSFSKLGISQTYPSEQIMGQLLAYSTDESKKIENSMKYAWKKKITKC